MSGRIRLLLGIVACFIAAIIGVFVGRALLPPRAAGLGAARRAAS
jgi:hypothetical protein